MRETDPSRRVMIVGRGVVTPIGLNLPDFWESIVAGRTGIDYLPEEFRSRRVSVAARIKDYPETNERGVHRGVQFIRTAADEALHEAGFLEGDSIKNVDPEELAAVIGTGWGGASHVAHMQEVVREDRRLSRDDLLLAIPCRYATVLTMKRPIYNAAFSLNDACASAGAAVIQAVQMIREGDAKAVITGGGEACVNRLGIEAFDAQSALSREKRPEWACLPFAREGADGFVLGEGAGILVLESLDHIIARGATDKIIAEIIGYKHCSDSLRVEDPRDLEEMGFPSDYKRNPNVAPCVAGAIAAMNGALKKADRTPEDIDYMTTHGTGTKQGNLAESMASVRVFGRHRVIIGAGKDRTGHMIAGDGTRLISATKTLETGIVPRILKLKEAVEVGKNLNFARRTRRYPIGKLRTAMFTEYGFGGPSIAIIIEKDPRGYKLIYGS